MAPQENANEVSSPGCSTLSLSRDGLIGAQDELWYCRGLVYFTQIIAPIPERLSQFMMTN